VKDKEKINNASTYCIIYKIENKKPKKIKNNYTNE